MNATCVQPGTGLEAARGCRWLWVAAGLLVCLVAVSGDSLWVDEALTANEVSHASFRGLWDMLARDKGSDLQMPLYIFHLWVWVKIFGTSEWALRAINIPWFVLAVGACVAAFSGRERSSVVVVILVSPFTWYFLNEARPYAVQISTTLIAVAGLYSLAQNDKLTQRRESFWFAAFCFGVVCLSASSLLGMVWAGACVLAAGVCLGRQRLFELERSHRFACWLAIGLLAATGLYYCWTLKIGARATAGTTDIRNLFFIAYELLGFGGLGPGRLEIRNGTAGEFSHYLLALLLYAVLLLWIAWMGMLRIWRTMPRWRVVGLLMAVAMPTLVLLVAGFILHFRVLDRHFAPGIAVVAGVLGLGTAESWRHKGYARGVVCAFLVLSLVSCLELRFAARHKKDDYRDAAAAAKAALDRGERVWWNAGWHGALYYHLPLGTNADARSEALWVLNSTPAAPESLPAPDVVISSKADMFDQNGSLAAFLRNGPYAPVAVYPAFSVWQRKSTGGSKIN